MARKPRQPRSERPRPSRPATASHDWEKDDEELALEEQLFGVSRPNGKTPSRHSDLKVDGQPSASDDDDEDSGMSGVDDDALFEVDAPVAEGYASSSSEQPDSHHVKKSYKADTFVPPSFLTRRPRASSSSSAASSSSSRSARLAKKSKRPKVAEEGANEPTIEIPEGVIDLSDVEVPAEVKDTGGKKNKKGKEKACVWNDPADEAIVVDLEGDRRMKKLARGKKGGGSVDGKELQRRLREQFESLHPAPQWAKSRPLVSTGQTPSLSSLLASTSPFIAASILAGDGRARSPLQPGQIEIQRLTDANRQNPTAGKREYQDAGGGVVDVAWHPSAKVPVMAVGGGDRRIRFFNIDGHTNPALLTLHVPALPLQRMTFHPTGTSLILTGPRPFYYTYDLASSRCLRSPRTLFGSQPTPSTPNSLVTHAFSPDGALLAVAGRRGAVSILEWSGTGVGAVVGELRSGRGGGVSGLVWGRDGREIEVLGGRDGAEVEVWDVGERKVVRKWGDEGAFGGEVFSRSAGDAAWTAIGSRTGIVNLYSTSSLDSYRDDPLSIRPERLKSLEHLTTPISNVEFHPSGEMMLAASGSKRDALRLYHLPSATAYANWPTPTTPLGNITTAKFSSGGEYISVGNQKGTVGLWNLRHFSA